MIDELMLKRINELEVEKICEFISKNLDKFTNKDIEILEDVIIEKKDIDSLNWFIKNVRSSEKLEKALEEELYNIPLNVETLSDEEVEMLKSVIEEYDECESEDKLEVSKAR